MEINWNDLKELLAPFCSAIAQHPYKIGEKYEIRTVTMIYTGVLKKVYKDELVLTKCHWVPDTGRWNEFISDMVTTEHESYGDRDVIIGRGGVLDACIVGKLPEGNK